MRSMQMALKIVFTSRSASMRKPDASASGGGAACVHSELAGDAGTTPQSAAQGAWGAGALAAYRSKRWLSLGVAPRRALWLLRSRLARDGAAASIPSSSKSSSDSSTSDSSSESSSSSSSLVSRSRRLPFLLPGDFPCRALGAGLAFLLQREEYGADSRSA